MRIILFLFIYTIQSSNAEYVIGKLAKTEKSISLITNAQTFLLTGKKNILSETRSLVKFDTYVSASIEKQKNNTAKLLKTPMIQSGEKILHGTLQQNNKQYYIDSTPVLFESAIPCYGTCFNQKSINYYLEKYVFALVKNHHDTAIVTAIIETDLYTLKPSPFTLPKNSEKIVLKYPKHYLSKMVFSKNISEKHPSYRLTIQDNHPVQQTDRALVITLGGRAGDDFEAQGGHFTLGAASINQDLSLDIEMFNFYPRFHEKNIIPGHTHFIDFFGGLTAGQTNYRPSYSLIIYGVDEKTLNRIRRTSGKALSYMRSSNDPAGLTHNCTTMSWAALNSAKVFGAHDTNPPSQYPPYFKKGALKYSDNKYSFLNTLIFALDMSSSAEVAPRLAYESLIKNLSQFNAKRIDFIFHQQVPSDRAQGGAPCRDLSDLLWFIKQQNTIELKKRNKKLQKWIEKMIVLRRENDGH